MSSILRAAGIELTKRPHFFAKPDLGLVMVDPNEVSQAFLDNLVAQEVPVPFSETDRDKDIAMRCGLINPYRRIIAKMDPDNPNQALIAIQIAITQGLASNMDALLDGADNDTRGPRNAITCSSITKWRLKDKSNSVNATQFLLDAAEFTNECIPHMAFPDAVKIDHTGTLSPDMSFNKWLFEDGLNGKEDDADQVLKELFEKDLSSFIDAYSKFLKHDIGPALDFGEFFYEAQRRIMALQLTDITFNIKKGQGRFNAYDPTTDFHCTNGAMPWDIYPMAHKKKITLVRSGGALVSYRYPRDEKKRESNRHNFINDGRLTVSKTINELRMIEGTTRPFVPRAHDWKETYFFGA